VDGFAGAGFAPEDLALEDLPRADLPGDGFALFGGILVAGDLAADFPPEGLSTGDLAGRGFINIGTSAGRCLRKRRACFTTDFLRDRERAIKPHTHTTCRMTFARAVIFPERSPLRNIKQNMSLNEVHPQMVPGRGFALVVKEGSMPKPHHAPDIRRRRAGRPQIP
jgi:hypothetical protein